MTGVPFTSFIVLAGGSSIRMGRDKIFAPVGSMPAAARVLCAAQACPDISEIIVAARKCDTLRFWETAKQYGITKLKTVTLGGDTRQASVVSALASVSAGTDYVAIHDCARPFVTPELISRVCADAQIFGAAVPAVPLSDTVKERAGGFVKGTVDREKLVCVQTPQIFEITAYRAALAKAAQSGLNYTDDSQLLEAAGATVYISEGDRNNIKLTRPQDLDFARILATKETNG